MLKTKLNYHNRFDKVWYIRKTRQDNNITDYTVVIYFEIKTELSWLIKQEAVYHER